MLVGGPFLIWDLICLFFSGCFSSWSKKVKQQLLWRKALILGGKSSLIIYGSGIVFWGFYLFTVNMALILISFILFRIVAFTLIYAGLVCWMAKIAEKFKVKKQEENDVR